MFEGFFVVAGLLGLVFMLILITVLMAVSVYIDAQKRYDEDKIMPVLWALIVLFTSIIGFIAYLLARPSKK